MVLVVTQHLARSQIDESARQGYNCRQTRLQVVLVTFEGQSAISEQNAARMDHHTAVGMFVDFKFSNGFCGALHAIFGVIGRVFFEFGGQTHSTVTNGNVFEHDEVAGPQLHIQHSTVVRHDVHLRVDVLLLDDQAGLVQGSCAHVHALGQVDCCEGLHFLKSFVEGEIGTTCRVNQHLNLVII